MFRRGKREVRDFAGLFVQKELRRAQPGQALVLGGLGLGIGPHGIRNVAAGCVHTHGISGLVPEQGPHGLLYNGYRRSIQLPGIFHHLLHALIGGNTLLGGVAGGPGGGVIVIVQVAEHAAHAHEEQDDQRDDALRGEFQRFPGVGAGVGQAQLGGDGQHHREEQSQQHRLQGEHHHIFDDARHGHGEGVLLAAHVQGVIPHHNGGLQGHVYEEVDGEAAEHDPGGGDLCPVQEQGEHHGTGHLRQHEGHEIDPLRLEQEAQHVRNDGADGGHHRAEGHGPQGVDEESGVDFQEGGQGNGHLLEHQPQGDHQSGEHQHVGVLQLGGSVQPVGF